MRKWKQWLNRSLLLLLAVFMISGLCNLTAFAMELSESETEEAEVTTELVNLGELTLDDLSVNVSEGISLMSSSNGTVDLNGGNYEKWIKRMDLPSYALDLYDQLVEGSDNDGYKDILISDSAFKKENAQTINYGSAYGKDTFYAIKVTSIKNPNYNQRNYIYKAMRAAFDAYLMDHPEVFWLSGESYGYCVITNKTNYTYYFLLKMHSGSSTQAFDIRDGAYRSASAIKADIKVRDQAVNNILNTAYVKAAENDYEMIRAFNRWLTENNEYNTLLSSGTGYEGDDAHECISALTGNYGEDGPVCEAYAKAFKILCDKKNIACVLTVGDAGGGHMWNSVRVNGVWYETDVTWNDPVIVVGEGAVSGGECEDYLLVGSETVVGYRAFSDSHVTTNKVSTNGVRIINGPIISPVRYIYEEDYETTPTIDEVRRLSGKDRYKTSMAIANEFMVKSNITELHSVIIASGTKFADALAGSYLANKTDAPILMTDGSNKSTIRDFINENLIEGGTIYILGGSSAVSASVEKEVYGLGTIERLSGKDRYATNIEILNEAGVENQDILVCTGTNFSDSLSASATKKPLLLVNKNGLTSAQKTFLSENVGDKIYVIGGTAAVSSNVENELKSYADTKRIKGTDRYATSVEIANTFFSNPSTATIAYALNFPDGLCGGPLAMAMNAPLILTSGDNEETARNYMLNHNISTGYVFGGTGIISERTANRVFGLWNEPVGDFEFAEGGEDSVYIRGWAHDNDTPDQTILVRVYIDGNEVELLWADKYCATLNEKCACERNHGFEAEIPYDVAEQGEHIVSVYALDTDDGSETLIGEKEVTIYVDMTDSEITNVIVSNVSEDGESGQ